MALRSRVRICFSLDDEKYLVASASFTSFYPRLNRFGPGIRGRYSVFVDGYCITYRDAPYKGHWWSKVEKRRRKEHSTRRDSNPWLRDHKITWALPLRNNHYCPKSWLAKCFKLSKNLAEVGKTLDPRFTSSNPGRIQAETSLLATNDLVSIFWNGSGPVEFVWGTWL